MIGRTEDRTPPDLENVDFSLDTGFLTIARLQATFYCIEEIRKKSLTLIRLLHGSRKSFLIPVMFSRALTPFETMRERSIILRTVCPLLLLILLLALTVAPPLRAQSRTEAFPFSAQPSEGARSCWLNSISHPEKEKKNDWSLRGLVVFFES